jgi:hypothetical protein
VEKRGKWKPKGGCLYRWNTVLHRCPNSKLVDLFLWIDKQRTNSYMMINNIPAP